MSQGDCYVNVFRHGSFIHVTALRNGEKVKYKVKYNPHMFVPSKNGEATDFRSIDGTNLSAIFPGTMYETSQFVDQYKDVSGFSIYGNTDFAYPFIYENWPAESALRISDLSVVNIDIETQTESGFPDPQKAIEEINAITMQNINSGVFYSFGIGPFANSRKNVVYFDCSNEKDLVLKFLAVWEKLSPDIVTGWHISFFDIPYLYNRICRIFSETMAKKMTAWGFAHEVEVTMFGSKRIRIKIPGIAVLDYLDLYKKFTYKNLESYRLDYVAYEELGEKKIDHSEFETFALFYKTDYQKFLEYNIRDVEIVSRLEKKLKLIELVIDMAYGARANFEDAFSPVKIWDVSIYNYLRHRGIAIPLSERFDKTEQFEGAFVFEPICGEHRNLVSFDLNSLYPNIIRFGNLSPETMLKTSRSLNMSDLLDRKHDTSTLVENGICLLANGVECDKSRDGFFASMLDKMYAERVEYKRAQLEAERELESLKAEKSKAKSRRS